MKVALLSVLLFLRFTLIAGTSMGQSAYADDILVYEDDDKVHSSCRLIGKLPVKSNFLKGGCSYDKAMMDAVQRVKDMGGNVLQITDIHYPGLLYSSDCYKIYGNVYVTDSLKMVAAKQLQKTTAIKRSLISDTAKYALLYVYYPFYIGFGGDMTSVKYDYHCWLSVNNKKLVDMIFGNKYYIKFDKEGPVTIKSKLRDNSVALDLNVKFGDVYFVRNGLVLNFMGEVIPELSILPIEKGYKVYSALPESKE